MAKGDASDSEGGTDCGSEVAPADDFDTPQTFQATHLLFSHLSMFETKKNTLSELNDSAPHNVEVRVQPRGTLPQSRIASSRQTHAYLSYNAPVSPSVNESVNRAISRGVSRGMSRASHYTSFAESGFSNPYERREASLPKDHRVPEIIKFAEKGKQIKHLRKSSHINKPPADTALSERYLRETNSSEVLAHTGSKFHFTFNPPNKSLAYKSPEQSSS